MASFVFEGGNFVESVLALCLKLLQLLFPVADAIATIVERLIRRLAIERGLQFGNRLIERRYLRLEFCDLIVIPLRVFPRLWFAGAAEPGCESDCAVDESSGWLCTRLSLVQTFFGGVCGCDWAGRLS